MILCIAVLHHIQSEVARRQALKRLYDALSPNGTLLITVWSYEQGDAPQARCFKLGDNIVHNGKTAMDRFYFIYDKKNFEEFVRSTGCPNIKIKWERQNWIALLSCTPSL